MKRCCTSERLASITVQACVRVRYSGRFFDGKLLFKLHRALFFQHKRLVYGAKTDLPAVSGSCSPSIGRFLSTLGDKATPHMLHTRRTSLYKQSWQFDSTAPGCHLIKVLQMIRGPRYVIGIWAGAIHRELPIWVSTALPILAKYSRD